MYKCDGACLSDYGAAMSKVKAKPPVKKPEKLSEKDLRELMNVDKPVYKKSRGAWRNA
jgi:hypothetical protein